MNEPIDIRAIEGRQRDEDLRRLVAGEVRSMQLQRENAIVQSTTDILHVDFRSRELGSNGADHSRHRTELEPFLSVLI